MNTILNYIFKRDSQYQDELDVIWDALADPVVIFDTKEIIVKANKAAAAVLQLHAAGLAIDQFLIRSEPGTDGHLIGNALKGNTIKNALYHYRDADGKKRYCTCTSTPLYDELAIAGVLLSWHDITESAEKARQLEKENVSLENQVKISDKQIKNDMEALHRKDSQIMVSNKLLEIIFSNTHFLIAYLNTDFNFIQVNDAYARAFSQSPAFFVGKNHFRMFPNDAIKTIFENVIQTGNSYITYAEPFFHAGIASPGITFWDWSLQPVKNKFSVDGIILVLIDVTRRKKAEDDLFNAKRLSDIGTLAATVAHELRNPLGVIQAATYNIKRKIRNKDIEKHITNINAKIEESEQIINNLLSYSQFKIPQLVDTLIFQFLDNLFADIMSKHTNEKIAFERNYDLFRDTMLPIDPVQIREVLNNIVNNAYQALPPVNGRIEVQGSFESDSRLCLQITDNGDGIAEEDLEIIFNPFFTRRHKGTGLGLTISKQLLKMHNGNIEITSKKGQGTTVMITLPLK